MKIIKEGSKKPWWVGKEVDCNVCGAKYQLELEDGALINTLSKFSDNDVTLKCANCGGDVRITNNEKLPVPPKGGTGETTPAKEGVSVGGGLAPNSSWGFLNNILK